MLKLHSSILSFIAVFFLRFPISVHSRTCEVRKGRNICGDKEEIWTVGYGNRSLEAVVECRNGGAHSLANNFIWCRGYPNCTFSAFVEGPNNQNVSAHWTVMNNSHLVSELEFYDVVGYSEQNFLLNLREISSANAMYIWNISIKYCPRENRNGVAILSSSGNSTYGSKGYFSCHKGYYLVDIVDNQLATNKATVCRSCARWDRVEKMDCWRAPKVAVNRSLLNNVFTAGDQLTSDICTVLDYGKPNASVGLFHDNLELSMPFTLEPQHNNMTVYCKARNQLTQVLDGVGKFMESFTVEVEFGPTEYTDWTSCTTTNATSGVYNVTLHVSLSANPSVDKPNTFVDGQKQIVFFKSSNGSVGCCGVFVQIFAITLTNVTKKSKVTVEFNQKIQKLKLIYNSITCNCSVDEKTTTANSIETGSISGTAIAIICSAVVIVLILIAGFIALCLKKRIVGDRALGLSSPPSQPTMTPMTINPASGASRKPESNGVEGSYEIPIKHEYATVRDENNERSYQNVPGVFNSGLNEDAAYVF